MSLQSRIGRFIDENPMKMYGIIFVSGDLFYMLNIFAGASYFWVLGAFLGVLAHSNKMINGKGALPVLEAKDYAISKDTIVRDLIDIIKFSLKVFTPEFWGKLSEALKDSRDKDFLLKFRKSFKFWHQPLDFGWILIFISGLLYAVDASNIFGLREGMSLIQTIIGLQICLSALVAFITDRNDIAGSLFASVTFWTLLSGVLEFNIPLFFAGLVFLYANYLLGKVDSSYQSKFTIDKNTATNT